MSSCLNHKKWRHLRQSIVEDVLSLSTEESPAFRKLVSEVPVNTSNDEVILYRLVHTQCRSLGQARAVICIIWNKLSFKSNLNNVNYKALLSTTIKAWGLMLTQQLKDGEDRHIKVLSETSFSSFNSVSQQQPWLCPQRFKKICLSV